MAIVNTLEVVLQATTTKFNAGMKSATDRVQDFAKKNQTLGQTLGNAKGALLAVNPVAAAAVAAIAAVGAATVGVTVKQAKLAEQLQKDALRIGTTVESLSQLRFATEQSGGSADGLTRALLRQTQAAGEALQGNTQLLGSFEQIGVSVEDLRELSPEELFKRTADGLNALPSAADRSALGLRILGEGFNELKPLIQEGSEGINALQSEADALGATISTKFANDSAAFLDNTGRLRAIVSGLGKTIAVEVLPILNQFLEWAIEAGTAVFPALRAAVFETVFQARRLGAWVGILVERMKDLIPGLEANQERLDELRATAAQTREEYAALRAEADAQAKTAREQALAAEQAAAAEAARADALRDVAEAQREINELLAEEIEEPFTAEDIREVESELSEGLPEAFDTGFTRIQQQAGLFWQQLEQGAQGFFARVESFSGGLADAIVSAAEQGGQAFAQFFSGLLQGLARAILRAILLRAILGIFGLGFGGFLGDIGRILTGSLGGGGQMLPATRLAGAAAAAGGGAGLGSVLRAPAQRASAAAAFEVTVHEATRSTWVEITDRHVVPRLDQRRDELNADSLGEG